VIIRSILAFGCCAALTVFSPVHAGIINGSFENGLLGWSSLGDVGAVGTVGPHMPTKGKSQAALETVEGGTDVPPYAVPAFA
jgi:hypothetical protein